LAIRFLLRLANKEHLTPENIDTISKRSNSLLRPYHASVGNIRVSKPAIEMDLFPPNVRDSAALSHHLEQEFGEALTLRQLDLPTPPPTSSRDVITLAKSLFNDARFWETHEEVEALWKTKKSEEKEMLQGFILVAVAFVHLQKNEAEICLSILKRAFKKLQAPIHTYEGLDIDLIRENIQEILRTGNPAIFKV
jgi:uncharacterized protein